MATPGKYDHEDSALVPALVVFLAVLVLGILEASYAAWSLIP